MGGKAQNSHNARGVRENAKKNKRKGLEKIGPATAEQKERERMARISGSENLLPNQVGRIGRGKVSKGEHQGPSRHERWSP